MNIFGGNELAYAAALGNEWAVEKLLSTIPVNQQDTHGITALHWAAAQGHGAMVTLLLDHGADINARDVDGNTPLHLAARNGNLSVVQLLLARGANPALANANGDVPIALAYRYPLMLLHS